jgi:BolA protein
MEPTERIIIIKQRLQQTFSPTQLDVIDDSEKHRGHAGSRDGAGHYTVIISADSLKGKSRIEVHREIYQALDDMIPREIHALQIKVL